MTTDPISDLLIRIKNAQAASLTTVDIPFSKLKYKIAEILAKEQFVETVERKGKRARKFIRITLRYSDDKTPAITGLERISKPGRRIYKPLSEIRSGKGGRGILILSTPKGVMTNREAKKQKVGGEAIAEIW